MNMRTLEFLPLLALAASLPAQLGAVHPNTYTSNEGEQVSSLFVQVGRYQQVLSDLRNFPKTLKSLGFRRDALAFGNADYVARSVEVEAKAAKATIASVGTTFAANYVGAPTTVFAKRVVSLPSLVDRPRRVPANFDVRFTFDAPYATTQGNDLLWEFVVTSTTAPGKAYPLDVASGSGVGLGNYVMRETGCTTPSGVMELRSTMTFTVSSQSFSVQWNVLGAPKLAASALWVGTTNPALTIPGVCTKIMSDAAVVIPASTSAVGAFQVGPVTGTYPTVKWSGIMLEAQAVSLDATQGGQPVALSNGLYARVPYGVPTSLDTKTITSALPTSSTGVLSTGKALITFYEY